MAINYVVAGTYLRYLDELKKLNLEDIVTKYVSGVHILTNATPEDFYMILGLVDDRKDYNDIIDKIKKTGMQLWEVSGRG